jgi:hypothetical protein
MTETVTIAQQQIPERVRKSIALFTGRRWVLPKLVEWWDHRDERLFLMTGSPGTGKSMLMAWLLGFGPESEDPIARTQLARLRGAVKAAHFCQASSRNITPQDFAQNVANQLAHTVPSFGEALAATLADRLSITGTAHAGTAEAGASLIGVSIALNLTGLGEESSFDRGFVQPLKRLYERGYDQPLLLIIDGLDETQTHADALLAHLLSQHADWPRPVRMLATTRNEPRILKFFRAVNPFDLVKDADSNVDDVRSYAEGRLAADALVSESRRQHFARRLAEEAKGVFLYASLVLDQLLQLSQSEFPDLSTLALPEDLSGIYHEFLTRELGKDEERWYGLYEPLLGLIAVAQGDGLTAERLSDIIGKDIRAALRASKQYLAGELPNGPFRPFHKSFSDFLFERKDDYEIDAQVWNNRIVDYYVKKFSVAKWQSCDAYGFLNLSAHLIRAGLHDRLNQLLEHQEWYAAKVRAGYSTSYQADVERAWAAADAPDLDLRTRCALQLSSVQKTVPAPLLRLCLDNRVVNSREARDLALLYESPLDRVTALTAILPALDSNEQKEAIDAEFERIVALTEGMPQSLALIRLAPFLSATQAGRVLFVAAAFDERNRGAVIAAMISRIGDGDVSAARAVISTSDASAAIRMLTALANRPNVLDCDALLDQACTLVSNMDGSEKVVSLCELAAAAPSRKPQLLDAAFTELCELDYSMGLAPAVARFVRVAGTDERVSLALAHAERTYRDEDHPGTYQNYLSLLAAVGGLLSDDQRAKSIAPVFARLAAGKGKGWIGNHFYDEYGPALLAGLPTAQQRAAFTPLITPLFRSITSSDSPFASRSERWVRRAALQALDALPIDLIDAAINAAQKIDRHSDRADALAKLLPRVEMGRRSELLQAELARVRRFDDGAACARAFAALAPYTPIAQRPRLASAALDALAVATPFAEQIEWLTTLMPHLPPERAATAIADALNRIGEMPPGGDRAAALAAIAASLPEDRVDQSVLLAEASGDDNHVALAALAPRMRDEAMRRRALDRVFEAFEGWRLRELPEQFVQVVRAMAPCLTDADHLRVLVLVQRSHILTEATEATFQAPIIELLAPRLTGDARRIAIRLTEGFEDDEARTRAGAALGSDPDRPKLFQEHGSAALATHDDADRARALCSVLPQVPASQIPELYDRMLRSCLGLKVVRIIGSSKERQKISREFMLERIGDSGQALARVGGEQLVAAIVRTIEEVVGRWP